MVTADNKEESEEQSLKSNNQDQFNFPKMSMKTAIGSRLPRDC